MSRLPIPGSDDGVWGSVLNDFLGVELNSDGTLKRAADINAKYTKPGSGIPASDLAASVQAALTKTFRTSQTWIVGGYVNIPQGDIDFINPIFVSVAAGQTLKLVACKYKINSGTSATVKLQRNGVDVTGFTGLSVTTTAATSDPADVTLTDSDQLQLVVTAIAGNPQNMSFSIFLETTA